MINLTQASLTAEYDVSKCVWIASTLCHMMSSNFLCFPFLLALPGHTVGRQKYQLDVFQIIYMRVCCTVVRTNTFFHSCCNSTPQVIRHSQKNSDVIHAFFLANYRTGNMSIISLKTPMLTSFPKNQQLLPFVNSWHLNSTKIYKIYSFLWTADLCVFVVTEPSGVAW
jgi:hypothetical protein